MAFYVDSNNLQRGNASLYSARAVYKTDRWPLKSDLLTVST